MIKRCSTLTFGDGVDKMRFELLTNISQLEKWVSSHCQLKPPVLQDATPAFIPYVGMTIDDNCGVKHIFVKLVGDANTSVVSIRPKMNQYIKLHDLNQCRIFRMCKYVKKTNEEINWTHIGIPLSVVERIIKEWILLKKFI